METRKVLTVGNSLAVSLPHRVASEWGLRPGDRLFLHRSGDGLHLTKTPPPLDLVLRRLGPHLGREVLAISVYGSFTKGRYRPGESDIDLLVLLADLKFEDEIFRATSAVELEIGGEHIFSPFTITVEQARDLLESGDPFIREALGGALLYGGDIIRRLLGAG